MSKKKSVRVVKYEDFDFDDRYVCDKHGNIIDIVGDRKVKYVHGASHGYPICYLYLKGASHKTNFLVHRIVACTWIGDTKGKHVHHLDHDKFNYDPSNLEILTEHEHCSMHNVGENNSTSRITEKDVHRICKMLKRGITHKKILTKMISDGVDVSLDTIDKIASGKNWKSISEQYDLKVDTREVMNQFSGKCIEIARMYVIEGLTLKEIAQRLGISTDTKSKDYRRLSQCYRRYVDKYNSGQYGLFRRKEDSTT